MDSAFIKQTLKNYYLKTNIFGLLQPSSGFYNFSNLNFSNPNFSNLILNFNALCPTKWKSGLILCFLNRAKRICSSDFLFDKEVSKLKKMFLNNGYPLSFFDKIPASFQSSNKFSQNISFENSFCIPYLGKESHHFANCLSVLIKNK